MTRVSDARLAELATLAAKVRKHWPGQRPVGVDTALFEASAQSLGDLGADLRDAREALTKAAVVLEVLSAQIAEKPYRELTADFQQAITDACLMVRRALLGDAAVVSARAGDQ